MERPQQLYQPTAHAKVRQINQKQYICSKISSWCQSKETNAPEKHFDAIFWNLSRTFKTKANKSFYVSTSMKTPPAPMDLYNKKNQQQKRPSQRIKAQTWKGDSCDPQSWVQDNWCYLHICVSLGHWKRRMVEFRWRHQRPQNSICWHTIGTPNK